MDWALVKDAVTMVAALGSLGCAVYVARRSKEWRAVDEADKRLTELEGGAREHTHKLAGIAQRVVVVEARLEHVATKADVARLEADVSGVCRELRGVSAGVERIEQWLIERRAA